MSMEDRLETLAAEVTEIRATQQEMQASIAELRTSVTEGRAAVAEFRLDVVQRLDTLIGAIADLRQEHHGHTHD